MSLIVTDASPEDIDELHRIETDCFTDPWSMRGMADAFDVPLGIFLSVKDSDSGETLGYIIGTCDNYHGYIQKAAVKATARRRGAGTLLLNGFCEKMHPEAECIVLEVRVSNIAAVKLYESFGFVSAGLRRDFYSHPREDASVMIFDMSERKTP